MSSYRPLLWPPPRVTSPIWKHGEKVRSHIEGRLSEFIKRAGLKPGAKVTVYREDYDAIAQIVYFGVRVVRGPSRVRA